jgi:formyltetrahydrofolate deformylase
VGAKLDETLLNFTLTASRLYSWDMDLIVTLQCQDQPGIVHAMTTAVLACKGNIIENQQFTDPTTNTFVMRTRIESEESLESITTTISAGLSNLTPTLTFRPFDRRKRTLIMATSESHCLRDLLYLQELNEMPIDIVTVVSNHEALRELVEAHGLPFKYLPIDSLGKSVAEGELLQLIEKERIELVVLARYMQILSQGLCEKLEGRIINIHHSFLPGFKGAKPYHQAHERGVKIIGATAHFVTPHLDEGPIISQDVAHVTHSASPEDLIAIGRDIERRVLSQAVKLFAQDRIFIVGSRTVVFQ